MFAIEKKDLFQPLESSELSYSGKGFRGLENWKAEGSLARRVTCELAYVALTVSSLVETVALGFFHLISLGKLGLKNSLYDAAETAFISLRSVLWNVIGKPEKVLSSEYLMVERQLFPISDAYQEKVQTHLENEWKGVSDETFASDRFPHLKARTFALSIQDETIREAYLFASRAPTAYAALEKIRKNELCILQTQMGESPVSIAFFDGYVAVCSAGKPLQVYEMDPSQITQDHIRDLSTLPVIPDEYPAKFKALAPLVDSNDHSLFTAMEQTLTFILAMKEESSLSYKDLIKYRLEAHLVRQKDSPSATTLLDLIKNKKFDKAKFQTNPQYFLEHPEELVEAAPPKTTISKCTKVAIGIFVTIAILWAAPHVIDFLHSGETVQQCLERLGQPEDHLGSWRIFKTCASRLNQTLSLDLTTHRSISKAFGKMSRLLHPDKNESTELADAFNILNNARELLRDKYC